MHETFHDALLPTSRHVCFGLRLQPLTLGHLFILHDIESPILTTDPVGRGDLLLAVVVCAQSWRDALRSLRFGPVTRLFLWLWGFKNRKRSVIDEATKFWKYLKAERQAPPAHPPKGEGRMLGAPEEWRLYELMRSYGATHEEALDTPVSRAACLWATRLEVEGKVELATACESVIHRLWKKRQAA